MTSTRSMRSKCADAELSSENSETFEVMETSGKPITKPQSGNHPDDHEEFYSEPEENDDKDKQMLARLRRRKEILELQCTLKALEQEAASVPRTVSSVSIDFGEVSNAVPNFSGDDAYGIRKWISDYEAVVMTQNCDARFHFLCACRLLTGTAKMFLRTITVRKWDELKQALLDEFDIRTTRQEVYSQLSRRMIRSEESIRRYVITMQELASHTDVDEADLIDFIIDGLGDSSSSVAILYGATTLKQLKELLPKYERLRVKAASSGTPSAKSSSSGAATPSVSRYTSVKQPLKTSAKRTSENTAEPPTSSPIRCYNCSQYGHISADCMKERRRPGSCFRCGKLGHVHAQCPTKSQRHLSAAATSTRTDDSDDNDVALGAAQLSD